MHARRFLPVVVIALLAHAPAPTSAADSMEWIADREIATYCRQFLVRQKSPAGTVCLSYIQGYLDALRTTELPARHELEFHVNDEAEKRAEHVSAVRLDALVEEFGPAARAGICFPEDFSEEEVVRVIARELRHGSSYTRAALDDYAQAALQERYPCDISDPMGDPAETEGEKRAPKAEDIRNEGEHINLEGQEEEQADTEDEADLQQESDDL